MELITYPELLKTLPVTGKHINAIHDEQNITVYQAYRKSIAAFAVREQVFGGSDFSFNRMSWIKTSFLWMMYRSGWAQKEGQETVLKIVVPKAFFETILQAAVISSYSPEFYPDHLSWREALAESECRLQWDPDHDPFGKPQTRKAIQLGLKGSLLKTFATQAIVQIDDITPFVHEQHQKLTAGKISELIVPAETVYTPSTAACDRIKVNMLP